MSSWLPEVHNDFGDYRHEPALDSGIAGGKNSDVVAASMKTVGKDANDPLGTAVARRRNGQEWRCHEGNAQPCAFRSIHKFLDWAAHRRVALGQVASP